jgi:hypothetical protein
MHALSKLTMRIGWGSFIFAYLFSLFGGVAQAQHVLPVLGTAPLLGVLHSTSELQQRVSERHDMFVTASEDLGLTDAETAELQQKILTGDVRWVRVPRHLDAMTWAWDGSVYMYRDVVIPPSEYGWEIDLPVGSAVHALFIPAACGNLSLVERSRPVAYVPPPRPQYVPPPPARCPNGMLGTPPNCYYRPPPPAAAAPPPAITPAVVQYVPTGPPWWVVPLALLGGFALGHYWGGASASATATAIAHAGSNCGCAPPPPPPKCNNGDP